MSGFPLGFGGQGGDVLEDVGGIVDGEGGAHFGEHVVLGFAWEERFVRLGVEGFFLTSFF